MSNCGKERVESREGRQATILWKKNDDYDLEIIECEVMVKWSILSATKYAIVDFNMIIMTYVGRVPVPW